MPQVYVNVDREKALKQGSPLRTSTGRSSATWAGSSSTTSTGSGASGRCMSRPRAIGDSADKLGSYYVRNKDGAMVPSRPSTTVENRLGPPPEFTMRYNLL